MSLVSDESSSKNETFLVIWFIFSTGDTATFSYIYKYNMEHKKFVLHQQVRTNAALDVTYFNINDEHFLVFANSYEMIDSGIKNYETQSVIYKHSNDYFTPFQTILLYGVEQFVPVVVRQHYCDTNFVFLFIKPIPRVRNMSSHC